MTTVANGTYKQKDKDGNIGYIVGLAAIDVQTLKTDHTNLATLKDTTVPALDARLTKIVDASGNVVPASATVTGGIMLATDTDVSTGTDNTKAVTPKQLKDAVDGVISDLSNALTFKGTKATYSDLPSSGNKVGDLWTVTAATDAYPANSEFAWTGSAWEYVGGLQDLSGKADKAGDNAFTGTNTFTGTVVVPTPTADTQAATKKYVDDKADELVGKFSVVSSEPTDASMSAGDAVIFPAASIFD